MKMKHDNLWRANPDTAEEMDEIERRRKRAMRTAITLLALAVAVNVAVNEFSCVGPSPSKRDAAPAVQQSAPDDRGGAGQAGADADGEEPALSLDYGTCTVVPLESLTGGSEKPERIERGGDAL